MKVKILYATLESYWYRNLIGEELEVEYNKNDFIVPFRAVISTRYIKSSDAVITELPESFCVKRCNDKEKWRKYLKWLNEIYKCVFTGELYHYYGVDKNTLWSSDELFGTEIHIDDMIKHIDYMETKDSITVKYENGKFIEVKEEFDLTTDEGRLVYARKTYPINCLIKTACNNKFLTRVRDIQIYVCGNIRIQDGGGLLYNHETGKWAEIIKEEINETNMETQKLSRQGLKEIYSVACSEWKQKLVTYATRKPLEDYIELTQDEVDEIFKACTKEQLPIVSKYLKQDDGSVDLSKIACEVYLDSQQVMIEIRNRYEYCDKAFWLTNRYDWEIKKDSKGQLCLIPTKKK